MYSRVIELGKDNPMACLIKDIVAFGTSFVVLYLIRKYIVVDKKLLDIANIVLLILFITTILHKTVVDKIIGAGKLECPIEQEERTVEENVNMKNGMKDEKIVIPKLPEINKVRQVENQPRQLPQQQPLYEEHKAMMPQQMNTPPLQYDMGGYSTLY